MSIPTAQERIDHIRSLLSRLESTPDSVLTPRIKVQIAHAWRIIESSELDQEGPWKVEVYDPQAGRQQWVGIGYHQGHGLDAARSAATLRYAMHRAALRWLWDTDDADLHAAVHALRPRLEVLEIARTDTREEDEWHVVLSLQSVNGRPRIPFKETVIADSAGSAEALARWSVSRRNSNKNLPVNEDNAESVCQGMWGTWETADVRKILPTIFALGEALTNLSLPWPDTPQARQVQRWITAIAEQKPTGGTYTLPSRTGEARTRTDA